MLRVLIHLCGDTARSRICMEEVEAETGEELNKIIVEGLRAKVQLEDLQGVTWKE